jgi:two-component system, sensor histidine kinase and response regulator
MTTSTYLSTECMDFDDLLLRVDGDRELICELLVMFKEACPDLLRILGNAAVNLDMRLVEITAHTMNGMLANVSALRARSAAAEMERLGRKKEAGDIKAAFAALQQEVAHSLREIDEYLARVDP